MVINKGFSIKICSDLDFEGMVIYVCFNDQRIAIINYDKGIDQLEIEIPSRNDNASNFILPFDDFLIILEQAKRIAIRCAKEDELRKLEE